MEFLEKQNNFGEKRKITGGGYCFRNTENREGKWQKYGNYRAFFPGATPGKSGDNCGKTELFHILHRFFHRGFPQEKEKGGEWFVYIIFFAVIRRNSTFSPITVLPMGKIGDQKKDLTAFCRGRQGKSGAEWKKSGKKLENFLKKGLIL